MWRVAPRTPTDGSSQFVEPRAYEGVSSDTDARDQDTVHGLLETSFTSGPVVGGPGSGRAHGTRGPRAYTATNSPAPLRLDVAGPRSWLGASRRRRTTVMAGCRPRRSAV